MRTLRKPANLGRPGFLLLLALACAGPAAAFSTTPSVCSIDASTMNANHLTATGVSPGGFSLNTSATFVTSGGTVDLMLTRISGGQIKGLLVWATTSSGTLVGSWTPSAGYAPVSGCSGKAIGHTSATPKSLPAVLHWTAPVDPALGFVTFHAEVVASTRSDHYVVTPISIAGPALLGVEEPDDPALLLTEPRPSPFFGSTTLDFTLSREQQVEVSVHDVSGRLVRRLEGGALASGTHSVVWNARDDSGALVPSGIYFVRLLAGGQARFQRVVRLAN